MQMPNQFLKFYASFYIFKIPIPICDAHLLTVTQTQKRVPFSAFFEVEQGYGKFGTISFSSFEFFISSIIIQVKNEQQLSAKEYFLFRIQADTPGILQTKNFRDKC